MPRYGMCMCSLKCPVVEEFATQESFALPANASAAADHEAFVGFTPPPLPSSSAAGRSFEHLPRLALVTFINGARLREHPEVGTKTLAHAWLLGVLCPGAQAASVSQHLSAMSCYAAEHGYPLYVETARLESPWKLDLCARFFAASGCARCSDGVASGRDACLHESGWVGLLPIV